jgi:hypothetical protein
MITSGGNGTRRTPTSAAGTGPDGSTPSQPKSVSINASAKRNGPGPGKLWAEAIRLAEQLTNGTIEDQQVAPLQYRRCRPGSPSNTERSRSASELNLPTAVAILSTVHASAAGRGRSVGDVDHGTGAAVPALDRAV